MPRRDDAPRDLLFGLLALQNGMVTRDQLVAAFGAWTATPGLPLADLLASQGALRPEHRPILDALAEAHLKLHGGDPEKSLAALDVNRRTRESLAGAGGPDVQVTLSRVGSGVGHDDDSYRTASHAIGAATADGQRFRVLRPHARGGLGVVFVALDGELNREVALKQILDHHADDPVSRSRFLVEAEITGGLEHPGIVPVYGLGTHGDGRPYYAMRLIKGDSLKEAIERFHAGPGDARVAGVSSSRLRSAPGEDWGPADGTPATRNKPLELRRLLRRFVDICNAIEYAHSRGVLHRDIKPGNVIVGRHGETLVVDWGLAKPLGKAEPGLDPGERALTPSSASGSVETLPGSTLGTPAYMSPEQAAGDLERLGRRSDVYSLGATLYCLLTGGPPFEGDVFEVLRKVQRGEFAPPRQLDPSIDRALETVCLKAMATKPEDRYASCRALADDVERWAADEAVSAWKEPWTRTLQRWLTRHRTGVTAAAAAVLVGVVGLASVLAVQTRAKNELGRANGLLSAALERETAASQALVVAIAELTRSKAAVQTRYDLAFEAIRAFHTGVSEDFLLKQDQFRELRDRLLKSAQDFYGKLSGLLGRETDFASRRALARSNFELAGLTDKVGNKDDALKAHRAVLAAREALAAEAGSDPAATSDLARSHYTIGSLLGQTGKPDEALRAYEKARAAQEKLARDNPAVTHYQSDLARSLVAVGNLLSATGKPDQALRAYEKARAAQEKLARENPTDNLFQSDLALSHYNMGLLLSATGKLDEALRAHAQARAAQEKLARHNPAVTQYQSELARSHYASGILLGQTGKLDEALRAYEQARAAQEKLVRENPAVTQYQSELARSHYAIGSLLGQTRERDEALRAYEQARAAQEKLARDNSAVTQFQLDLARTHFAVGSLLDDMGKPDEALRAYELARAAQEKLVRDNPTVTQFQSDLAGTYNDIGALLRATGKPDEALGAYELARAAQEKLARDNPTVTQFQSDLARSHNNIGNLLSATDKPDEALRAYEQARAAQEKLARDNPAVALYQNELARTYCNSGNLLRATGKPDEALRAFERARAAQEKLARDNPKVPQYRGELANTDANMGVLLVETGKPDEALRAFETARAIWEAVVRDNPAVAQFRGHLALSHNNVGDVLCMTGKPHEALRALKAARAIREALVRDNPSVPGFRRELAASHDSIGTLLSTTGKPHEALRAFEAARAVLEALVRDYPTTHIFRRELAATSSRASVALRRLGRPGEARDACERAIALQEVLVRETPNDPPCRGELGVSHCHRGLARRDLGDPAGATADIRRALALRDGLPSPTGQDWFETACAHAALAGLAGRDGSGVPTADGPTEADRALALLRQAVVMGYRNPDAYRAEDALDPLRDREDFHLLMLDLTMPEKPFAP